MRNAPLLVIPFLLLFSAAAHGEIFKCTVAGNVEYRDVPCTSNAEQEVIALGDDSLNVISTPTDPVAVAAQLREADKALSERLEREHIVRMQIAAQQAQLDQQERIAEETRQAAELQYSNVYLPVGGYLPFVPFHHHIHRHFNPSGQMIPPSLQFHQHHMVNVNSFGARCQSPIRAGSFTANVNF
jgi:hypothetical protein